LGYRGGGLSVSLLAGLLLLSPVTAALVFSAPRFAAAVAC
jgi:hypothetical protein